jgi:ABC-type uncharacterized transport system substrate-binding protein
LSDLRLFRHGIALIASMIGATVAAAPASAHPHVFIDYAATVLCDGGRVAAVRMSWIFDEMYSASLYQDYTSRPPGPLDKRDVAMLKRKAFDDTKEEHYFIDLRMNGKSVAVNEVEDFDASYDGRKMTYRFTVPIPADAKGATILDIASFDTEFYIDFELLKHDPLKLEHDDQGKVACAPKKETRNTTTFGPLETMVIHCSYGGAA